MEFLKAVTQEAFTHETPARLSSTIFERLNAAEGSSSLYILWGFFAFASLAAAVAICFTPGADRRLSTAISTPGSRTGAPSPALARLEAARAEESSPEELLLARLQALENQVGTMTTGSIQPVAPPAPGVTPPASQEVRTALPPAEAETEPPVTRTMFGIDLGSEASFGGLRMRWEGLRRKYPELARLSPRIAVRDNKGKLELRLVAGPFENASDAAKACAAMLAKGAVCDGGLFDGQHLPQS